jgi:lipoprotein-releasing system permease protein
MAKFSMSAGEVMIGSIGANLKGVDLERGADQLRGAIVEGDLGGLGRPAAACGGGAQDGDWVGRIVLGERLAERIRAKVGACIGVLVPFAGGAINPVSRTFEVVGIFRMGYHEYDTRLAFVALDDVRRLSVDRNSIFGLELRFTDELRALEAVPDIEARLGPEPRVLDWRMLNQNLFAALSMQRVIISLILVIIIVVAASNILASLTMIVLSKVREIAVLGTLGARRAAVMRVFLAAGSFVGLAGTGLGIAYGLLVCGLAHVYGYQLDAKVYLIERLPVRVSVAELLLVALCTQIICVLATLYPARRAARLTVVDGLRYS